LALLADQALAQPVAGVGMFMITKLRARLRGGYYERIRGTPLFSDFIEASAFAEKYLESHPKEFQKGLETIQVRPVSTSEEI
jgi:hypothetical protein